MRMGFTGKKAVFRYRRFIFQLKRCVFRQKMHFSSQTFQNFAEMLIMLNVWLKSWDLRSVQRCVLCRSRRELSNEFILAQTGVDTAENEPFEVWGENSIQDSLHSLNHTQHVIAPEALRWKKPNCPEGKISGGPEEQRRKRDGNMPVREDRREQYAFHRTDQPRSERGQVQPFSHLQ